MGPETSQSLAFGQPAARAPRLAERIEASCGLRCTPLTNDTSSLTEAGDGLDGIRTKTALEDWAFTEDYALPLLRQQLRVHSLDGMGLANHAAAAVAAGAIAALFTRDEAGCNLAHIDTPAVL